MKVARSNAMRFPISGLRTNRSGTSDLPFAMVASVRACPHEIRRPLFPRADISCGGPRALRDQGANTGCSNKEQPCSQLYRDSFIVAGCELHVVPVLSRELRLAPVRLIAGPLLLVVSRDRK